VYNDGVARTNLSSESLMDDNLDAWITEAVIGERDKFFRAPFTL